MVGRGTAVGLTGRRGAGTEPHSGLAIRDAWHSHRAQSVECAHLGSPCRRRSAGRRAGRAMAGPRRARPSATGGRPRRRSLRRAVRRERLRRVIGCPKPRLARIQWRGAGHRDHDSARPRYGGQMARSADRGRGRAVHEPATRDRRKSGPAGSFGDPLPARTAARSLGRRGDHRAVGLSHAGQARALVLRSEQLLFHRVAAGVRRAHPAAQHARIEIPK